MSRNAVVTLNRSAVSKIALVGVHAGARHRAARIVDEHVDPPELGHRRRDEVVELLGLHHVGRHCERAPAQRFDLGGDRFDVARGACRADDVGARFGERDRDAATDALARAGDDRDLSVEPEAVEDHRRPRGAARPAMSGRSR